MNFLSETNTTTNYFTRNPFKMEPTNTNMLSSTDKTASVVNMENKLPTNDKLFNKHQNINQVWTKENFDNHREPGRKEGYLKANLSLDLKPIKTTWASRKTDDENPNNKDEDEDEEIDESELKIDVKETFSPTPSTPDKETASPSHHARRPMNAFLIFCKKHRPIVRQKFPHLENRGVTRILGEWWALLDSNEKSSYTSLAKEYKDAFFSANPDFKWYKLPAPPLRTLNTRPVTIHKISSPLASPTQITPSSAEFTPGKLADETQLGNLTSLLKTNNNNPINVSKTFNNSNISTCENLYPHTDHTKSDSFVNNNNNNNNIENNNEQHKQLLTTPIVSTVIASPPKPIKKRKFDQFDCVDNKKRVVRNIFDVGDVDDDADDDDDDDDDQLLSEFSTFDQNENSCAEKKLVCGLKQTDEYINGFPQNEPENMTKQELMDKVVDSMFPDEDSETSTPIKKNGWALSKQKLKETRKSGRSCKGKRYAEFMIEGKLLGNKQMRRFTQYKLNVNNKFENTLNNKIENILHNKTETQTPKLDLGDTIKRLAERTNTKLEDICPETHDEILSGKPEKRKRTESENSDDSLVKLQSEFNLDLRISELPSLSYEAFLQRKKESKKRKSIRSKSESSIPKTKAIKLSKSECNSLVGSKKRKNKNSITRLEQPVNSSNYMNNFNNDLYALATLAEIAANTEKIN